MNPFKAMLNRTLNGVGDALQRKPMRCLAVLVVCAVGMAHGLAPAKEVATPHPPKTQAVDGQAKQPTQNTSNIAESERDFSERISRLEERERQLYAQSIEASRKSLDWWFSFLAVLTTFVGVAGAFLPWLIGRKDKELLQSELQNARDMVHAIQRHEKTARQGAADIEAAKKRVGDFESGKEQTPADQAHTREAAEKVGAEPTSSDSEKLRARAVLASQKNQPTPDEAKAAYDLWFALSVLRPDDASAHFNAGYWAQVLFDTSAPADQAHWLALTKQHYAQVLAIKPDMHEAANNWGYALAAEARVLQAQDMDASRALWKAAGEKYAQALAIKQDMHEAANNWGNALAAEARALQAQDLDTARALWKTAGEKFNSALKIKPSNEAAFNWGIALADEARAVKDQEPASEDIAVLWRSAAEKFEFALRIKMNDFEAASRWGTALAEQAAAHDLNAPTSLAKARDLWQEAGRKWELALKINPEWYHAANSWGTVLDHEAQAMKDWDLPEARRLWAEAGEKYQLALSSNPRYYEAACNWGVALANEAQAVKTLLPDVARTLWQQAGKKYQQALSIEPALGLAYYNWGNALLQEAMLVGITDLTKARDLWAQAGEKYDKALAIEPQDDEVANNWGNALVTEAQALTQVGNLPEARDRWVEAAKMYRRSLEIKKDHHLAASNLGLALASRAHLIQSANPEEAAQLLTEAQGILENHRRMGDAGARAVAYHLALVYARQGNAALAVQALERCRSWGVLPSHWRRDPFLVPIHASAEYLAWIERHFPGN